LKALFLRQSVIWYKIEKHDKTKYYSLSFWTFLTGRGDACQFAQNSKGANSEKDFWGVSES